MTAPEVLPAEPRPEWIEQMARGVYHAAFANYHGGRSPEPGWCWERCGPTQQEFATRQARAAYQALRRALQENQS